MAGRRHAAPKRGREGHIRASGVIAVVNTLVAEAGEGSRSVEKAPADLFAQAEALKGEVDGFLSKSEKL